MLKSDKEEFILSLVNDGYLSISKCGEVKNIKTGNILGSKPNHLGYHLIGIKRNKKVIGASVHRLVYILYGVLPLNEDFPIVNHIDGNKSNNDIFNLERSNYPHNRKHAE